MLCLWVISASVRNLTPILLKVTPIKLTGLPSWTLVGSTLCSAMGSPCLWWVNVHVASPQEKPCHTIATHVNVHSTHMWPSVPVAFWMCNVFCFHLWGNCITLDNGKWPLSNVTKWRNSCAFPVWFRIAVPSNGSQHDFSLPMLYLNATGQRCKGLLEFPLLLCCA